MKTKLLLKHLSSEIEQYLEHVIVPTQRSNEEENTFEKKILIVDDNDFNLVSLSKILKLKFNLESDQAYNGQEAVDKSL